MPSAASADTPFKPSTATGSVLAVVFPVPSCPPPFAPHATTVPSLLSARLCVLPALTACTDASQLPATPTRVGLLRDVVVLSPS